jgi:carbamoyl-phosphate synthase large subunit
MNILLTAAGGPSAICFARSLKEVSGVRLIGTNAEPSAAAHLFDSFVVVPLASDERYLETMRQLIANEQVDCVIPLVDEELLLLARERDALGATLLASPYATIELTSDKGLLYTKLADFLPQRFDTENAVFPLFGKPRRGRGGKGAMIINSRADMEALPDSYLFQELLAGPEISVDAFFDTAGRPVVSVPRVRGTIDQGISIAGEVFADPRLAELIAAIAGRLSFVGPVNFQFMRKGDEYRLIEINARGSGGMGITIRAGADMPKLSHELIATGAIQEAPTVSPGHYENFEEVVERQRRKKTDSPS